MPVRTEQELTDYLNRDLSWRKRELTTIYLQVQNARDHIRMIMIRSGVCLLYAHWEGFIRGGARGYLEFVARRRLRFQELRSNFLVAGLYEEIRNLVRRPSVELSLQLIDAVLDDGRRFTSFHEDTTSARSNLGSQMLRELLSVVGVDSKEYLSKNVMIDRRLVQNRNMVAHGEQFQMTPEDYLELHGAIIEMMNRFRNDLENAAAANAYRS
ncbi:MAG: MAE_28990/MAE_18760 family HEPN-like nuclease [Spirochaetaceae bacterium]|nr:MAE_28990/MAE_18760 family HEPN-like nuclease [Spirochaetaceae bacterium]